MSLLATSLDACMSKLHGHSNAVGEHINVGSVRCLGHWFAYLYGYIQSSDHCLSLLFCCLVHCRALTGIVTMVLTRRAYLFLCYVLFLQFHQLVSTSFQHSQHCSKDK